ncbi:MAG: GPW/gp25 family protein [Acidobacteriota bacterium]
MNVGFPFAVGGRGRLVDPTYDEHVREMIELVLFTAPGERVNRPDFGSGLLRLVFSPRNPETLAAVQFQAQSQLQQWLGHVIDARSVAVEMLGQDALKVIVNYLVRRDGQERTATFERRGLP